jgi:hypothetical protein
MLFYSLVQLPDDVVLAIGKSIFYQNVLPLRWSQLEDNNNMNQLLQTGRRMIFFRG